MRIILIVLLGLLLCQPVVHAAFSGGGEPTGPASEHAVTLLIIYVLLALVFSFLCSVAEAVLLSITPSYIGSLQESRPKIAALLTRLKQENVDQSLAAILTLNTVAHTVGAIGSGAQASVVFESPWVGVFSAVMTLLILFLSEIIPKTLGAVYWRSLAGPSARFIQILIFSLYPLIYISERLTRLIARGKEVHAFSRDEFVALASIGEEDGHLEESESRIIKNLFRFRSLRAEDIMTPRPVIHGMPSSTTVDEAVDLTQSKPFSRIPIFDEDLDQVGGYVLRDDVLMAAARDQGAQTLATLKRSMLTITEETLLLEILETMLDKREHIAIVVCDYGGTRGLVTLEDVVETLLGADIVDEIDRIENMRSYARRRWAHRAEALGIEIDEAWLSKETDSPAEATDEEQAE